MPQGGGEIPLPRGVVFCISDRHCGESIFEDTSKFSERDMPPVGLRSWIYHFPHLKSKTHKALEKAGLHEQCCSRSGNKTTVLYTAQSQKGYKRDTIPVCFNVEDK